MQQNYANMRNNYVKVVRHSVLQREIIQDLRDQIHRLKKYWTIVLSGFLWTKIIMSFFISKNKAKNNIC